MSRRHFVTVLLTMNFEARANELKATLGVMCLVYLFEQAFKKKKKGKKERPVGFLSLLYKRCISLNGQGGGSLI